MLYIYIIKYKYKWYLFIIKYKYKSYIYICIDISLISNKLYKIIYIITLNLYLQIKTNITSRLSARNLLLAEVLFTLIDTIDRFTSSP